MPGNGTATLNFGSFPGSPTALVAVTGQGSILTGSLIEAWISPPGGSSDHSEDEHVVENIKIRVGAIVVATGFTIFGECWPLGTSVYGNWNVAWAWV
jgi:hypothetical protein